MFGFILPSKMVLTLSDVDKFLHLQKYGILCSKVEIKPKNMQGVLNVAVKMEA